MNHFMNKEFNENTNKITINNYIYFECITKELNKYLVFINYGYSAMT